MINPVKQNGAKKIYFYRKHLFCLIFISIFASANDIEITTQTVVSTAMSPTQYNDTWTGYYVNCDGNTDYWEERTTVLKVVGRAYISGSTHCRINTGHEDGSGTSTAAVIGPNPTPNVGTKSFLYPDSTLPAGNYRAKLYVCAAVLCSYADSYDEFISTTFSLNGSQLLSQITIPPIQYHSYHTWPYLGEDKVGDLSFCIAIVNSGTGMLYGTGKDYSCTDANELPGGGPTTTICTLNNNNPVNVVMGSISRNHIGTFAGGNGKVDKPVSISCDSTNDVPVDLKLTYTPLTGSGDAAVTTSSGNLGVSVRLNDTVWMNNEVKSLILLPGANTLDLDFTPIKRSGVAAADISVGNYSASASLVMTWQ